MRLEGVELGLPRELDLAVVRALERWRASDGMRRLHARDATLWTGGDEPRWLDWLEAPWQEKAHLLRLTELQAEVRDRGFTRAVVLGMGGSSLFPEVIASTFATAPHHPALAVLDSTVPSQHLEPLTASRIVSMRSSWRR